MRWSFDAFEPVQPASSAPTTPPPRQTPASSSGVRWDFAGFEPYQAPKPSYMRPSFDVGTPSTQRPSARMPVVSAPMPALQPLQRSTRAGRTPVLPSSSVGGAFGSPANQLAAPPTSFHRSRSWRRAEERAGLPLPSSRVAPHLQPLATTPGETDTRRGVAGGGRSWLSAVKDWGITGLRGAISVPESIVGMAEVMPPAVIGRWVGEQITGRKSPTLGESLEANFGFKPKESKAILSSYYSEFNKEEEKRFAEAPTVVDKIGVALENPGIIGRAVAESLPLMLAGGAIGRGLAAGGKISATLGGALGEGAMATGSMAEQIRQETGDLTPLQAGASLVSGAATSALGLFGGSIAKRLGIDDVDTLIAGGLSSPKAARELTKGILQGAVQEGFLEELPQSVQEQVLQNIATGQKMWEGVDDAAVLGTLAGVAMGGGGQVAGAALSRGPQAVGAPPVAPQALTPSEPVGRSPTGQPVTPAAPLPAFPFSFDGFEEAPSGAMAPAPPRVAVDTSPMVPPRLVTQPEPISQPAPVVTGPEIGTSSRPGKEGTGRAARAPEVEPGDVSNDEADELMRVLEEMDALPYVGKTFIDGEFVSGGAGGAPVYHDIVGGGPDMPPLFKYTRAAVTEKIRQFAETGKRSVVSDLAMDVVRRRLVGDRSVSRPYLPPEAASYVPPEMAGSETLMQRSGQPTLFDLQGSDPGISGTDLRDRRIPGTEEIAAATSQQPQFEAPFALQSEVSRQAEPQQASIPQPPVAETLDPLEAAVVAAARPDRSWDEVMTAALEATQPQMVGVTGRVRRQETEDRRAEIGRAMMRMASERRIPQRLDVASAVSTPAANAEPAVMTFDEYSESRGVSSAPPSRPEMHRGSTSLSEASKRSMARVLERELGAWAAARARVQADYDAAVAAGTVRSPTPIERLESVAGGRGEQAAAAQRVLDKRRARQAAAAAAPARTVSAATERASEAASQRVGRTRPRTAVEFATPITGPTGVSLEDYQWAYELQEDVDDRGELKTRRVSDWTQAATNEQTGRQVVHQFGIKKADGTRATVSLESALRELGYLDGKAANPQEVSGRKAVESLVSTLKTRATHQLRLAALDAELAEIRARVGEIDAAIAAEPRPTIVPATSEKWGRRRVGFAMGDAFYEPEVVRGQPRPVLTPSGQRQLEERWRDVSRAARGFTTTDRVHLEMVESKVGSERKAIETLDAKIATLAQAASEAGQQQARPQGPTPAVAKQDGAIFETGRPVTFAAIRSMERAPDAGGRFKQDIEPAGRYLQAQSGDHVPPGSQRTEVSFSNPLVLAFNAGENVNAYDEWNWKSTLSKAYGGQTGSALSQAIRADGYDGIVTVKQIRGVAGTDEIVDLRDDATRSRARGDYVPPPFAATVQTPAADAAAEWAVRKRAHAAYEAERQAERDRIEALPRIKPTALQLKAPPKGFTEGTVDVKTNTGPVTVPAFLYGPFAIHHDFSERQEDGSYSEPRTWHATHVATGYNIGPRQIRSSQVAADMVRKLSTVADWTWDYTAKSAPKGLRDASRPVTDAVQAYEDRAIDKAALAQVLATDALAQGGAPAAPAVSPAEAYSPSAMASAFQLSPEQAEAVDTLVRSMGLDTSKIAVARGGDPGRLHQDGPNRPRLSAIHQLSAENVKFAHDMGGLAVPSIAVVPEGSGAIRGFGEITLVARSELGRPEKQPIFDADAYSPRFPTPKYGKAKMKDADALAGKFRPMAELFDGKRLPGDIWDNAVTSPDPESTIRLMRSSTAAAATYLAEHGIDVKPVRRRTQPEVSWVTQPSFKRFLKEEGWKSDNRDSDAGYKRKLREAILAAKEEEASQYDNTPNAFVAELLRDGFEEAWFDDDGVVLFRKMMQLDRAIEGIGKTEIRHQDTRKRIDRALRGREADFASWIDSEVLAIYPAPHLVIGGRHVPYTLDNIVRKMTTGKVAGAEETLVFGEGKARAAAAKRFASLEAMRKKATQIVGEDEIHAAREKAKKLLDNWRDRVIAYYGELDHRGNIDTWNALDASMRALSRWATSNRRPGTFQRMLRAEGFNPVPEDIIAEGIVAGEAFMSAPVPYFESKPQRAVALSEFAGAIIPSTAPPQVRAMLEKHGVTVATYRQPKTRDDTAARDKALNALRSRLSKAGEDVLFQAPDYNGPKGSVEFATDGSALVRAFEGADVSTALHEIVGHIGRRQLLNRSVPVENRQGITDADIAVAERWAGATDGVWSVESEERFARGFERYLRDGQAPNAALRDVFAKIKAWLSSIYEQLRGSDINLRISPEMRRVFDRIVTRTGEQPAPVFGDAALDKLNAYEEILRARLRARGFRASAGIPADAMADVVALGAVKVAKGAVEFAQWSVEMVKELGEGIRPHLQSIWAQARDRSDRVIEDQLEAAPVFYSQLEQVIAEKVPARAKAEQVRNIVKKSGLPKEEIEWSGLDEWLADKQAVTRDEVLDFVRANRLELTDVTLGQPQHLFDEVLARRAEIRSNYESDIARMNAQLTSGELPRRDAERLSHRRDVLERELKHELDSAPIVPKPKYEEFTLSGKKENYREVLMTLPHAWKPTSYKGSHFDEPNIVAHLRMDDRIDATGRKVLFIEEVQSDWHQAGRKLGYETKPDDTIEQRPKGGVPNAPYKTTWPELAMKRALRYAAEGGYDAIAWTTGEQQADRYDLSKKISEIHYSGSNLVAYDHDGETVMERTGVMESELPDIIGKEPTEKLLSAPKRGTLRSITGQDLKVGGEGMAAFYDTMLPSFMKKYGKQWGAVVGEASLATNAKKKVPVHSMDVTPSMKRSLVYGGQAQFGRAAAPKEAELFDRIEAAARKTLSTSNVLFQKKGTTEFGGRIRDLALSEVGASKFRHKTPISAIYDAYGMKYPDAGSMADFKKRLMKAAAAGEFGLLPLDDPSGLDARVRTRSEIDTGIEKLHFVELPEQRRDDVLFQAAGPQRPLPFEQFWNEIVGIGAAKIGRGISSRAAWDAEMTREFGESVAPRLDGLWTDAHKRMAWVGEVQADEFFNFGRVNISKGEQDALRDAVIEAVIVSGQAPKTVESHQSIRDEARELHPDLLKHLEPFQATQAAYRVVRMAARQRINALNREIIRDRADLLGMHEDERMLKEGELQRKDVDLRGLLGTWAKMRSEDGRNLAMHRMMADSTWEDGRGFDHSYWLSRARRSMGLPTNVDLPLKTHQQLNDILSRGDEIAKTGVGAVAIQQELADFMATLERTGFLEAVSLFRKANLLTGIKTHFRNIGGNMSFTILEEASRLPASLIDSAMSAISGTRTVQGVSPKAVSAAAYAAGTKGVTDALAVLKTGVSPDELVKAGARREMNTGIRWLDAEVNYIFRTLAAEDKIFKSYAFRRSIEEQAQLMAINQGVSPVELLANPTEEMLIEAVSAAEFATFNNPNMIARGWRSGLAGLETKGPAGKAAAFGLDVLVPYANTPSNLLARLIDYTAPGAAIRATYHAQNMIRYGMTEADQRAFAQAIGRGAVGTALAFLGWKLAASGLAVGLGYGGPGEEAVEQAAGRIQGSIRFGHNDTHWHLVAPFSPTGNLIALGATMWEERSRPLKDEAKRVGKMLGIATSMVMEQPMMSGMRDMLDALKYSDSRGERLLAGTIGSFVPTAVADISSLFDPYRRDARPAAATDMLWVGAAARLPGLRNLLPEREDVLGRKQEQTTRAIWDATIAPVARELDDAVLRELVSHRVGVNWPRREYEETAEAYRMRARAVGKTVAFRVKALVSGAQYGRLSEAQQRDLLEDAVASGRRTAAKIPPARVGAYEARLDQLSGMTAGG